MKILRSAQHDTAEKGHPKVYEGLAFRFSAVFGLALVPYFFPFPSQVSLLPQLLFACWLSSVYGVVERRAGVGSTTLSLSLASGSQ